MLAILFCSVICLISSIMLVWFKTDAIAQWLKLFGFGKLIKYDDYNLQKFNLTNFSYPLFLKTKYNNFFFKLIGCPLCLCGWLSIFGSSILPPVDSFSLLEFILRIIIYSPIIYILSLCVYGITSKLTNENK